MLSSYTFSNLQELSINEKTVLIVDKHQYAFPLWAYFSIQKDKQYSLITFDFHTDTHLPFRKYAIKKVDSPSIQWARRENIRKACIEEITPKDFKSILIATKKLANDEHIQTAYQMEFIREAHVVNCSYKNNIENHFYYYSTMNFFDIVPRQLKKDPYKNPQGRYLLPFRLNRLEDDYINSTGFIVPNQPFILDFDLDYFPTRESLNPQKRDVINELVKCSELITIAREKEYFNKLREQRGFYVQEAEALLIQLIDCITCEV